MRSCIILDLVSVNSKFPYPIFGTNSYVAIAYNNTEVKMSRSMVCQIAYPSNYRSFDIDLCRSKIYQSIYEKKLIGFAYEGHSLYILAKT
jgi:hypothetical protein